MESLRLTSFFFFYQANRINRRFMEVDSPLRNRIVARTRQLWQELGVCYRDRNPITRVTIMNTYTLVQ